MQSLAAYSFEAVSEDPESRLEVLDSLIDDWLEKKGATAPRDRDGDFVSKTGDGTGQFLRHVVSSSAGELRQIELIETASTGAMFTTSVQIASSGKRVIVYASLSATPGESRVSPIGLYPRCPLVIRTMIDRFRDWKFADEDVPLAIAFDATASADAKVLCDILRSNTRRLPILVVSNDEDEAVWKNLHVKAAEHLVGLAHVAYVNAESSWVLTDELGPRNSCYFGAVRLYWPGYRQDGSLASINWLASKLTTFGDDDAGMSRFLAILRREIMSVAALTMEPPSLIRDVLKSSEKERLLALEKSSRDKALDSIIEENARLQSELEATKQVVQTLQWKLASANYAQRDTLAANDAGSSNDNETSPVSIAPAPGETRYYKKIGSGGGVDTMVVTKACNHNNWKPAFKAEKAEKGVQKLEGKKDWKSFAHCNECTGGGRWKVTW